MENENRNIVEPTTEETVATTTQPEIRCEKCQAVLKEGQTFCHECGTPQKLCKNCGARLQDGQAFCIACGHTVTETAPAGANFAVNQFNTPVTNQNNQKNKIIPIVIAAAAAVIIIFAIIVLSIAGNSFSFEKEFSYLAGETWCEISSDGSYMNIDSNPNDIDDYYDSEPIEAVEEINLKLGFSSSVFEKMKQTRSLDGRITEENDKFRVSWTYHPDDGLEVMYEKK